MFYAFDDNERAMNAFCVSTPHCLQLLSGCSSDCRTEGLNAPKAPVGTSSGRAKNRYRSQLRFAAPVRGSLRPHRSIELSLRNDFPGCWRPATSDCLSKFSRGYGRVKLCPIILGLVGPIHLSGYTGRIYIVSIDWSVFGWLCHNNSTLLSLRSCWVMFRRGLWSLKSVMRVGWRLLLSV